MVHAKATITNSNVTAQFSVQNRWYVRQFYREYSASELLQPLVGEISWDKHLLMLNKCKDTRKRQFYTVQTRRHNWTKAVLAQQQNGQKYQRTVRAQRNFAETLPAANQVPATLALKDAYLFAFLELMRRQQAVTAALRGPGAAGPEQGAPEEK